MIITTKAPADKQRAGGRSGERPPALAVASLASGR